MPKMSRRRKDVPQGDLEEQFEAFLKESISSGESSLDSARVAKYLRPKTQPVQPQWLDNGSDSDDGLVGTGKSFLKPKKSTKEPPPFLKSKSELPNRDIEVSRDGLDDVSLGIKNGPIAASSGVGVPNLSLGSTSFTDTMTGDVERDEPGLDTLAELSEKKKFFEELERNSDGTLDFSRLNRELDHSSTLPAEKRGRATVVVSESEDEETESDNEDRERITVRGKDVEEENRKQSMLSKVALSDSLDSTLGTRYASQDARAEDMGAIPEDPEQNAESWLNTMLEKHSTDHTGHKVSLKTGTGLDNTNTTQEMEALQQALKQAGMSTLGSTRDLASLQGSSSAAIETNKTENTVQATDPDRTHQSSGFGLEPMLPSTGKSTVDELLEQVRNIDSQERPAVEPRKHLVQFADEEQEESEEERGFSLSPAPGANHGFDLSPVNTKSIEEEPEKKSHHGHDPTPIPASEVRPVAKPRKGSFSYVKSSGYGLGSTNQRAKSGEVNSDSLKEKRKPSVVSVKEVEKKPSKNRIAAKWSPMSISQEKIKGSGVLSSSKTNIVVAQDEQQLMASVNSFANYIKDHFGPFEEPQQPKQKSSPRYSQEVPVRSSSQKLDMIERERALLSEVKDWQEQWKQERKINNKLRIEVEHLEKDNLRRLEDQRQNFEEQIFKFKQENYVLQARISEGHPSDLQRRLNQLTESGTVSTEQIDRLEKEIQDQEKLLSGYQQENERLYQQMKQLQTVTKTTEEKLFRDNDKLKTEVQELKEKLERKEIELKTKGIITSAESQQQIAAEVGGSAVLGAGRIAQLEAELKLAKQREDHLLKEIDMLTKTKQELEAAINQLIKKVQEFEKTAEDAKKNQSLEVKDLQQQHKTELEMLNRRLKWYAENQQLLDEDAEIIKQKVSEIAMLQEKLNNVSSESGKKQIDIKNRAKERAADAKRIQDLERQVKEMEGILRKRHPNSLPVLMWAASSAPDPEAVKKTPSVEFLEKQINKLQTELESKDDGAKRSIRAMEQKFSAVKLQYEERINTLESHLSKYERPKDVDHPHFHIAALSKEMDAVKERHRKRVAELEAEVERQRSEIHQFKMKETANQQKAAEKTLQDLQNRVSSQHSQLSEQQQEKTSLNGTIERLQKEKLQLQTELARMSSTSSSAKSVGQSEKLVKTRGRSGSKSGPPSAKTHKPQERKEVKNLLPYTSSPEPPGKVYEPDVFAGSHINDVYQENEKLKVKLERLKLQQDQESSHFQKILAEAVEKEQKARDKIENQLVELKMNHQQDVNKMLTEQVKMKSTSKITELQNQLDTQNVVVRHLKQQLNESGILTEQISTLKIKETVLEEQVKQLAEELGEAKKSFSPEMRHFEALKEKLEQMEKRHAQRELELERIIAQSRLQAASDLDEESNKWKTLLESKNHEVEKFRSELDSILGVLRELQRQGVLLPGQNRHPSR